MKENSAYIPEKDKRKKFEAVTEHAKSLPNKEHEPVSITSNRNNSNIEYYKKVYQMIPAGKDNAVSMADLSKMLKVDKRQCRKIVSRMRESSYQIVGDNAGYYKPSTNKELFDWYKSVHSRAMTGLNSLKCARRIMKGNGIEMSDNNIFTSAIKEGQDNDNDE